MFLGKKVLRFKAFITSTVNKLNNKNNINYQYLPWQWVLNSGVSPLAKVGLLSVALLGQIQKCTQFERTKKRQPNPIGGS